MFCVWYGPNIPLPIPLNPTPFYYLIFALFRSQNIVRFSTNRLYLTTRMCSDNAQVTPKRGKNKKVCYEMQDSSVTDFLPRFVTLCHYQSTRIQSNRIYLFYELFWYRKVKNHFVVMICTRQCFAAYHVVRASVLKSQALSDHVFYFVHFIMCNFFPNFSHFPSALASHFPPIHFLPPFIPGSLPLSPFT